jgi:RimJ/RimL family protein N-acetyltransferase
LNRIELGHITLRNWQKKDIKSLAKNANNKKIWDNLRDEFPYPYTEMAAKQWIAIANEDNPLTNFAIEYKGNAVGGVGIILKSDVFRQNAEIGYWLGEKYWNKGIGTKVAHAMVEYSFQHFNIVRIFANVFETNVASIRVLEKCNFKKEATLKMAVIKNNQVQNCYIYSILKEELL